MLYIWKRSPMLRLCVPLILGIYMQTVLCFNFKIVICSTILLLGIITGHMRWFRGSSYKKRHRAGILFYSLFFFLGAISIHLQDERTDKSYFATTLHDQGMLIVQLLDAPDINERSVKIKAEVVSVLQDSTVVPVKGKLLLFLEKDSLSSLLRVDDVLLVNATPKSLPEIKNPGEFDYRKYQERHQIYEQAYVKSGNWIHYEGWCEHSFLGWFIQTREDLLAVLRSFQVEGQEYAVLAALVLGKTSDIDKDLMASYASAGAVHVLAVSGLHVALIYMVLSPVLKRIFRKRKMKWLKTLLPITLLWLYAGLTGFSPSVLRAALMFTCFIIADNFQKENNIYNTMSASALILLCAQPFILFEVGFQLSYLAVLGIVILHKRISTFFYFKNKVAAWAWNLTSVSVAAQIFTLPVTLFLFHQFPTYFVFTNLLVIPLSTVILYTALIFFMFTWLSGCAHFLAGLSAFLTRIMNESMEWTAQWPFHIIDGIDLNLFEFILVTLITGFACHWVFMRSVRSLSVMLASVVALLFYQVIEFQIDRKKEQWCVHSVRGHDCISWIRGNDLVFASDSILAKDRSALNFHFQRYWDKQGVNQRQSLFLSDTTLLSEKSAQVADVTKLGNMTFGFPGRSEFILCNEIEADVYILSISFQERILQIEDWDFLSGKMVFVSDGWYGYKRKKLMDRMPEDVIITDLSEGAWIFSENKWNHFLKDKHASIPQ